MPSVVLFDLMDTLVTVPRKPKHLVFDLLGFESVDDFDDLAEDLTIRYPGMTEVQFFDRLSVARGIDNHSVQRARQHWERTLRQAQFLDGAREVLLELRKKGIKVGIVSNAFPPTHKLIDRLNLYKYVDHVFLSCDLGAWKPNRQIFLAALERMHASAEGSIMVGNKIATDVVGALEAQLFPVLLDSSSAGEVVVVQGQTVPVVQKIREFPLLLQAMIQRDWHQTQAIGGRRYE